MDLIIPNRQQVANKIKEIRARKNLTQAKLASELGLKQSAVKNYEGGRIPGGEILARLAQIGGVSVDWILGIKGPWDPFADLEPHQQYLIQEMAGEFRAKKNAGKRRERQSKG